MKDLIINVYFAHLRLHPFPHLLFQGLVLVAGLFPYSGDACGFNVVRELEGRLMNSSLVLQVSSFLGPVARDWNCVPDHFHLHKEKGIIGSHVPAFNHVRPSNLHFQIKYLHAHHEFSLLFRHFLFFLFLVLVPLCCFSECIFLLDVLFVILFPFIFFSIERCCEMLKDVLEF